MQRAWAGEQEFNGATRRDRTGDLLITKNIPWLQTLHSLDTDVPDINNLGKLLPLKQQLGAPQTDGVLAQFLAQEAGVE